MDELERQWPALLADQTQIRDRLLAAYGSPDRGYHDLRHLAEVIERVHEIIAAERPEVDVDGVLLAAWFHDAVYEADAEDEERSALLAERELATVGAPDTLVDEVARLVRLTATHKPDARDLAGQVLCDADLAILAAGEQRYRQYVDGVRREYAHLSDDEFQQGRAAVLRTLLDKPTLFATGYARRHWENAARANVTRELAG